MLRVEEKVLIGVAVAGIAGGIIYAVTRKKAPSLPPPSPPPGLGNVYGQVTDALTGNPIKGAIIIIDERQTKTNSSGNYVFDDIEPGEYFMQVIREGYAAFGDIITVTEGNNRFDFELKPIADVSDEVRIVGVGWGAVTKDTNGYDYLPVSLTLEINPLAYNRGYDVFIYEHSGPMSLMGYFPIRQRGFGTGTNPGIPGAGTYTFPVDVYFKDRFGRLQADALPGTYAIFAYIEAFSIESVNGWLEYDKSVIYDHYILGEFTV